MSAVFWVHSICAFLCCVALTLSWRQPEQRARAFLAISRGCFGFIALMAALGLVAYASFGVFFTAFHHLLFEGDTWLFSPYDTLIQLFPVEFWMDATWLMALLTTAECATLGTAAYALSRRQRQMR